MHMGESKQIPSISILVLVLQLYKTCKKTSKHKQTQNMVQNRTKT